MRSKKKTILPNLALSVLVVILAVNFTEAWTSAYAQTGSAIGQTLLDALPKLPDLPEGYAFKSESAGVNDFGRGSGGAYSSWTGSKTAAGSRSYDSIRIQTYAFFREGINDSYPEWSPDKFRAHRLTQSENGHFGAPYQGLPGGVIVEYSEGRSQSYHIFVRLFFWKSRYCKGDIYIQYNVDRMVAGEITRQSYESRINEGKVFCRSQIERLAKLMYSRLPEGEGTVSGFTGPSSSGSASEPIQKAPISPETVLVAVAGGSLVMTLGGLLQLWGMGGLQNLTGIRGVIDSLLASSGTEVTGTETSLQENETVHEVEVIPKEPEAPVPESVIPEPVLPDPVPPGFEYQGKVWYQPPWDTGGPYWMNKNDYSSMRSMMRQGKEWSDRWGWVDREEGKAMESQRAKAWGEFKSTTDPELEAINKRIDESRQKLAEIRDKQAELEKIEQLRERQAELEKQRELDNSFATQLRETMKNYVDGVNRDLDALPGDLGKLALGAAREIRDITGAVITAAGDTAGDLTDGDNWKAVGRAAVDTAKELILHPVDSSVKVGDTVKSAAGTVKNAAGVAGNVVAGIASNPIGFVEAVVGIDNWKKVLDPNVSVGERVTRALYGAVDASLNFASGGTKVAAKGMEAGLDGVKLVKGADAAADAAKTAKGAEAAADAAKLTAKLDDPARAKAWEAGRLAGQQKADKLAEAIKSGDAVEIKKALVECQKDKHAIQTLNRGDDSLKVAYNQNMKKLITDDVDRAVKGKIAQRYGIDPKDVEIVKPTNPTGKPKIGSDLDFTVKVKAKPGEIVADPNKPGNFIQVKPGDNLTKDVPIKDAQQIYNRELHSKVTGEPIPTDPKKLEAFQTQADKLAHDMDHVAGHRVGAESYGASQQDLEVILKKSGGQFTDPEQAGQLATFKSTHLYQQAENIAKVDPNKAEQLISDGMRQTTKQYDNLIETRMGVLQSKGIDAAVDPRLTKAVDILKQVETKGLAPVKAEALLKSELNMSKDDVANMLGGQLAKLHMMKPK